MDIQNIPDAAPKELTAAERTAVKYHLIKDKINLNFAKGCRILKIAKITVAVLFVLFTVIGVIISRRTGHTMGWLLAWLALIFINIAIFITADYSRYLVESKVIPYLNDDEQTEFGEYDIFAEDIDGEEDEEEEDEEEEYY